MRQILIAKTLTNENSR